jgi:hypothetical protein
LDRSGDDADEVGDAMQRSFDALEESLSEGGLEPTNWTEYVYEADGALDAEELESNFPFEALPYILVFDGKVDRIEIELPERRATYTRAKSEELGTDMRVAVIEGIDTQLSGQTWRNAATTPSATMGLRSSGTRASGLNPTGRSMSAGLM